MPAKKTKRWIAMKLKTTSGMEYFPKQVPAWVLPGVKYLFVNKGQKNGVEGWVVTHRPTGLALNIPYVFEDKKHAVEFMRQVNEIADWSIKEPSVLRMFNPILQNYCMEIMYEVGGVKKADRFGGKNKQPNRVKKRGTKKKP